MTDISHEMPSRSLAETSTANGDASPLKTYSVLYAEDIPHYGGVDIEAPDDAEAVPTTFPPNRSVMMRAQAPQLPVG